jgi:hypothetical protein
MQALEQRDWFTAEEAGKELGYAPSTVRKYGSLLGARQLGRGPYRYPKTRVAEFKANPSPVRKPTGIIQALAKEVAELSTTGKNRDNRIHAELRKLLERIERLEKAIAKAA